MTSLTRMLAGAAFVALSCTAIGADNADTRQSDATSEGSGTAKISMSKLPQSAIDAAHKGRFDAALPAYREAARSEPDNPVPHDDLGIILVAAGQIDEGIGEFRQAIRLDSASAIYPHHLALGLMQAGRTEDAIKEFERSIDLDASYRDGLRDFGILYLNLRQYPKAIECFSSCIKLKDSVDVRLARAMAYYRSGQNTAAVQDCDVVLRDDSKNHRALAYRAYANLRARNFAAARQDAESALSTGDDLDDLAYVVLGGVSLMQGDTASAVDRLSKAIALRPNNPLPYVIRALAYLETRESDNLIDSLDAACHVTSGPHELNFLLDGYGWQVYKLRGLANLQFKRDNDSAIRDLTQAIALNKNDPDCYALRALGYLMKREWTHAQSDLEHALTIDNNHGLSQQFLVHILATCPNDEIRDARRAIKIAKDACQSDSWSDPILMQELAAAYSEIGDFANAIDMQSKVLDLVAASRMSESFEIKVWWNSEFQMDIALNKSKAAELLDAYKQRKSYRVILK